MQIENGTHIEVSGNSDDGVGNLLAQEGLGDLLHLAQNHSGDLLRSEGLLRAAHFNLDHGLAILGDNLVRKVLNIVLNILLIELATDQTPGGGC